jgi:hypothetical protein
VAESWMPVIVTSSFERLLTSMRKSMAPPARVEGTICSMTGSSEGTGRCSPRSTGRKWDEEAGRTMAALRVNGLKPGSSKTKRANRALGVMGQRKVAALAEKSAIMHAIAVSEPSRKMVRPQSSSATPWGRRAVGSR